MPDTAPTTSTPSGCTAPQPCSCHPSSQSGAPEAPTVALSKLQKGQTGRICECQLAADDAALLRAMGLCTNARVRLCRVGEPCIVAIDCGKRTATKIVEDATRRRAPAAADHLSGTWTGSRIGLARSLAERILVAIDG